MGPVVLAAVAVGAAAAQWMNSESARKASKEERERMADLIAKVKDPNFDARYLTPEDYQIVGKFIPEVAPYVEEANPTLVKANSKGAKKGRESQMAALDRFRTLGETGDDEQSRLLRTQSLRDAQVQNQGQQASIQQNFAQRGLGGSGLELISSLLAQQGANKNASESSERAAMESYNRRLDALRTGAALGGDIRGQDIDLESKNAGIINSYNQRFADARNNYNQYAAGTKNDAQKYNLGNMQDIANKNVDQNNAFQQRNQDVHNDIEQQKYANALSKIGVQANQSALNQKAIYQNNQDKNSAIQGLQQGAYQGMNYYQGRQDREEDRADRQKYYGY